MSNIVVDIDDRAFQQKARDIQQKLAELEKGKTISLNAEINEKSLTDISAKIQAIADKAKSITFDADFSKSSATISNLSIKDGALDAIVKSVTDAIEKTPLKPKIDTTHIRNEVQNAIKEAIKNGSLDLSKEVQSAMSKGGRSVKIQLDKTDLANQITAALSKKGVIRIGDITADRQRLTDSISKALAGHTFQINVGISQTQARAAVAQALAGAQVSVQGAAGAAQNLSMHVGNAARHGRALSDQMKTTTQIATLLGNTFGNLFASYAVKSFLDNIVKIGGELEKQKLAMESIMGDSYKAQETYSKVSRLSMISPFNVEDLLKYTKQLNAFGIKYNELYDTTKRLSDIAAAVGVSFGRIAYEYGQTSARGWLDGRELRMFANSGIPLLQKLADHYSRLRNEIVTTAQVREMVTDRQVSFEDVKSVLWDMTNEGGEFFQMQEVMAESLAAKYANLANAWNLMLGRMAEGTSGGILKRVAEILTAIVDHFEKLIASLAGIAPLYVAFKLASYGASAAIAMETAALEGETAATELNTAAKIRSVGIMNSLGVAIRKMGASLWAVIGNWWSVGFAAAAAIGYAIGHYREKMQEIEQTNQALRDRANDGLKNLESLQSKLDEIFGENKTYEAKVSVTTDEATTALTGIQSTGSASTSADSVPSASAYWEDAETAAAEYEAEIKRIEEEEKAAFDALSNREKIVVLERDLQYNKEAAQSELDYLYEKKEELEDLLALEEESRELEDPERLRSRLQSVIEEIDSIERVQSAMFDSIQSLRSADLSPAEIELQNLATAAYGAKSAIEMAEAELVRLEDERKSALDAYYEAKDEYGMGSEQSLAANERFEKVNEAIREQEQLITDCNAIIDEYTQKITQPLSVRGIDYSMIEDAPWYGTAEAESAGEAAAEAFVEGVVAADSLSVIPDSIQSAGENVIESVAEATEEAIEEVSAAASEGTADVVFSISDSTRAAINRLSAAQRKSIREEMLSYLKDYDPDVNKTLNAVYSRNGDGSFVYDEIEQLAMLKQAYDETVAAFKNMAKMDGILEAANQQTGNFWFDKTAFEQVKRYQDYFESRLGESRKNVESHYAAMSEAMRELAKEYPQLLGKIKDGDEERNMTLSEQIDWLTKHGNAMDKFSGVLLRNNTTAYQAFSVFVQRFYEMGDAALESEEDIRKFADSVESQMKALGYDLNNSEVKKMLKVQLNADLNTKGITSETAKQLIFQEFVRRKMIIDTEVLTGTEGSSDTEIQKAARKAIEGMNSGVSSEASKAIYTKIERDIINGSATRADMASKLRDRYSKINTEKKSYAADTEEYKELEMEADALERIAAATKVRLDNVRGLGSGHKKDAQLEEWKEQVKLYREAYQEYKKWFDLYHDSAKALEKTKNNPLYAGIENPNQIRENLLKIADEIAANKGNDSARGKYEVDVRGIINGIDYDAERQRLQDFLSNVTEQINAEAKKWDIYKKMFEATGNQSESLSFAQIGTGKLPQVWDYQARVMREAFEKEFANVDFSKLIGNKDIWGFSDADAMTAFGNGELYRQWKAIKDHIEKTGIEYLGNAATLRKNAQTAQERIDAENARYKEERENAIASGASEQMLADIDTNHQNRLNELKDELFQLEPVYQQVLEGTLGMTRTEIDALYQRCKELLVLIDATKQEVRDQNGKLTGYRYKRQDGSEGFINKKTYDNLYNNATGGSKSGSVSANWKNWGSKFKRTEQDKDGKTTEKFDLQNTMGQISSLMGSMQSLGGLFDTLGLEDEAGSLGTIMNSLQAGMTIAEGYFSGDPSKMLEGAIQLVTTLAQVHDNKLNAAIEASKARVEDLKGAYEQVESALESVAFSGTAALEKLAAAEAKLSAQLKAVGLSLTQTEKAAYKAYQTGGSSSFVDLYKELDAAMNKYNSSMAEYEKWSKKMKVIGGIGGVISGGDIGTLGVVSTSLLPVANTISLIDTTLGVLQGKWKSDYGWNFLTGGAFGVFKSIFGGNKAKEAAQAATAEINRVNEALADLARLGINQDSYLNATDLGKALMGQYSNLVQQRMELEEQLYNENAKKKSDKGIMEDYKDQIAELNTQIAEYLETVARELYDLDLNQWSKNIAEAIADAFRDGTSEVQAFEDAVNSMLENVANNIIALGVIQPYIDKLQKHIFGDPNDPNDTGLMGIEDPNARMTAITKYLSEWRDANGKAISDEVNSWLESFKQMGLYQGNVSGTSASIEGITAEQADILAAYLNGIRLDTNALRLIMEKFGYEDIEGIRDVLDSQLRQLETIADNTYRTAIAAEAIQRSVDDMYDDIHGVVLGSKEFHTIL